jgi:hypothetical protein
MKRELAEFASRELLLCAGKLDKSVALVAEEADEEFLRIYRHRVGEAMAIIYLDVLSEIYQEFPDLEPAHTRP